MLRRSIRSQAAIDFLTSYGFAILVIGIAVYAVLQLGIFNYSAAPQYCYSQSPFSCIAYSVNTIGAMAIVLSQSSGGVMTVNGIACSGTPNTSITGPFFGNVRVQSQASAPSYYPGANTLGAGITMLPGAQYVFYVNCYSSRFGPAHASIGSTFTGYVWVRYSFSGLPSTYNNIVRAASFSTKYT